MAKAKAGWVVALALGGCSADTAPLDETGLGDASVDDATLAIRDAGAPDASSAPDAAGPLDAGAPATWVGTPCTSRQDCPSADSPYADLYPNACMGTQEDWPGGYCVDYCTLPPDPFVLPNLARADCPLGAVCLSRSAVPGQNPPEDIGACVKECQTDADCRTGDGYFCRHRFGREGTEVIFDNGYCAPAHCASRGCPTSYACQC